MSALVLTAVLTFAAFGAFGCLAVSLAIIGWLIRDHRKPTVFDWSDDA